MEQFGDQKFILFPLLSGLIVKILVWVWMVKIGRIISSPYYAFFGRFGSQSSTLRAIPYWAAQYVDMMMNYKEVQQNVIHQIKCYYIKKSLQKFTVEFGRGMWKKWMPSEQSDMQNMMPPNARNISAQVHDPCEEPILDNALQVIVIMMRMQIGTPIKRAGSLRGVMIGIAVINKKMN